MARKKTLPRVPPKTAPRKTSQSLIHLVRLREVTQTTGISTRTLLRLIYEGKLKSTRISNSPNSPHLINPNDMNSFLEAHSMRHPRLKKSLDLYAA